jgi:hypothetical protein
MLRFGISIEPSGTNRSTGPFAVGEGGRVSVSEDTAGARRRKETSPSDAEIGAGLSRVAGEVI